MTIVYVIEAGAYENREVVGVELTPEAARASLERWDKSEDGRSLGKGSIEEYQTGVRPPVTPSATSRASSR